MTILAAAGYISNNARTQGEAKTFFEDELAAVKEFLGGENVETLVLAAGTATPTRATVLLDTEAAAATDDCDRLAITNHPAGRFLLVTGAAPTLRVVTLKHGLGGAGQFLLADATDFAINAAGRAVLFQERGTDWVEVARFFGNDDAGARSDIGAASTSHEATHISGGSDAFTSAQLLEAQVKRILETSGPTALTVGTIVDGEFLKRVGATVVSAASAGGGGTLDVQVFTVSGTWTRPDPSVTVAYVKQVGGGAGGGGGSGGGFGAGGGGSGDLFDGLVSGIAGNVAVTIGAGGAGGTSAPTAGSAGGSTSFGAFASSAGGSGGGASGSNNNFGAGGGTLGADGANGIGSGDGSSGGASAFGGGGVGSSSGSGLAGRAARAYGAGGGGSGSANTAAGGAGKAGYMIVVSVY